MKELKTLRDMKNQMNLFGEMFEYCKVEELKAEAIKWWKEINKNSNKMKEYFCMVPQARVGAKEMLITFFNLIEENLK